MAETLDHLLVAVDEKYIDAAEYAAIRELQESALKVLNGYIAYLKRCVTEGVPQT